MNTPSIGLALIVKNEEASLPHILKQLTEAVDSKLGLPTFDQIVVLDTGSTDKTLDIVREIASRYPIVELHETSWKDSFRTAREESFAFLRTDFQGWCDSDDEWFGLELLRDTLTQMYFQNPETSSLWCQYYYDRTGEAWTQVHLRERFVRADGNWKWSPFRCHEHLITNKPGPMAQSNDIGVYHLRDRSRDPERNERNIRLIKLDIRDFPKEPRLWFDLGSQYYHTLKWRRSIYCYKHFLTLHKGPNECYQALHRMADGYRQLGKFAQAIECEKRAIFGSDTVPGRPQWADAWFGLAECATAIGDWQMVLAYNAMGNQRIFGEDAPNLGMPDQLLVTNPLDYNFHPMIFQHVALANMGKFDRARHYTQQALQIVPASEDMLKADGQYHRMIQADEMTQSAIDMANILDDVHRELLYRALPNQIRHRKNVRDALVAPTLIHRNAPDVTIWCGPSLEDWGPKTPYTTGIGGSETAVIAMADHLNRKGLDVAVYNQCGAQEGQIRPGLRYIDYTRVDSSIPTKLYVGWRNPSSQDYIPDTAMAWLWMHDLNSGEGLLHHPEAVSKFNLIRPVSQWHADHLAWLYPFMKDRLVPTRNGIDLERFAHIKEERQPHRAIWMSSPDRGLQHIMQWWPEIRQHVDDAELHVYYGFETLMATAKMTNNHSLANFRNELVKLASQPGVFLRGRVNQTDLVKELYQATMLAYSSTFLEVSMISAVESMAAGVIIQATLAGALPETTAGAAILVRGHPLSEVYRQVFIQNLVAVFKKPELGAGYVERGLKRAQDFPWSGVADEWIARMEGKVVVEEPRQLSVGSAVVA